MALADWSEEDVLKFIDELKHHPCLLNPKDENGRPQKKFIKNLALGALSAKFGGPASKLKKKINSLLQSYRTCQRKIKANNDGFRPSWFAFDAMNQMMQDNRCTPVATATEEDDIIVIDSTESDGEVNGSDLNDIHIVNTNENINTSVESGQTNFKRQLTSTPNQLLKKKKTEIDKNEVHINEAYENLVHKQKESEDKTEKDECIIFGSLVATRLKNMDEVSRQYIICEINNLFLQTQIYNSNRTYQHNTNVNQTFISQSSAFNQVIPYSDSRQLSSFDYVRPYSSQQMHPTQVSAFPCISQPSLSEPSALSFVSEPSSTSTVSSALQPSLPLVPYHQSPLYNNYASRPYPSQQLHQTQVSAFSSMSQPPLSDSSVYLNHHISEPFPASTICHASRTLALPTSSQVVDYDWLNAIHH